MLKIAEWTNSTYMKRLQKLQLMIPIFFARFISQNLIAVDTMKSTRRFGLLGIIGRMGSMDMFLLVNLALLAPLLDCNMRWYGWMGGLKEWVDFLL